MASVNPAFSDQGLDALEAFLLSDAAPPEAMPIAVLDGFLTAIVIGPELIIPSAWLPMVWGGGSPDFADLAEANLVIGAIMARYNAIIDALDLDPPLCAPILHAGDRGDLVPEDWADGFAAGVQLGGEAWLEIVEHETAAVYTYPILGLCLDENGDSRLELDAALVAKLAAAAPLSIPECVVAIRKFWMERRRRPPVVAPLATGPKIGRNAPCPCGSGRKFKRCCGAGRPVP